MDDLLYSMRERLGLEVFQNLFSEEDLMALSKGIRSVSLELENMAENMDSIFCLVNADQSESVTALHVATFLLGYCEQLKHITSKLSIIQEAQSILEQRKKKA